MPLRGMKSWGGAAEVSKGAGLNIQVLVDAWMSECVNAINDSPSP